MPNKYLPKILHKGELIEFIPKVLLENIEGETGLKREDALKIVEEVGRQFIASAIENTNNPISLKKPNYTTKPQIRVKTNSVMMDLGYMEAYKGYTRIGMSMYEAKAIFEVDYPIESKMRQIYDHMKEEYDGVKELKYDE